MAATTDEGFALDSGLEEVALRRKLLFRLLRDFDFARPKIRGELISDPVAPECRQYRPARSERR